MEELVLKSERLAMQVNQDPEMPRIQRNLSQILQAGNLLWRRTVGSSANRDASEIRASVLLGARGFDYQKISRNLDGIVSRALKGSTNRTTLPVLRGTDIKRFVRCEREDTILEIIEETKLIVKEQVEKLYWTAVQNDWRKEKLALLDTISSLNMDTQNTTIINNSPELTKISFNPSDTFDQSRLKGDMDDETVVKIALECEQKGQFEEAVKLYDSISKYEKVLQILTMLISEVLPSVNTEDSKRGKLESMALGIANKYCESQIDLPRETAGTFFLLLDLMTFFNYYHSKHYNEALDTIQKLKILPSKQNEVETKSREFNRYPEEIRRNISDILMATMNILYSSYKEQPTTDIKQKAKALITFSGLIQYRLPSDTIARMIELEVLINS